MWGTIALRVHETDLEIASPFRASDPLAAVAESVGAALGPDRLPVRFVVSHSDDTTAQCEIGLIEDMPAADRAGLRPIFEFRRRGPEDATSFNVAFLVPTGIGSSIGGHAGDATPAARLIASVCDRMILHPNVVNASDVNEMPDNALYVEGSVLTRLLMGTAALQPVRANRVLTVMDYHPDDELRDATVNTVNAARATYGLSGDDIVLLDPPITLSANYTASGRASGRVGNMDLLMRLLDERRGSYDAVALATVVVVPFEYHAKYFASQGEMVNPWGGSEAILTHTVSSLFNIPTAHAPITSDQQVAEITLGVVDPRMAAEAVSFTYFQCVLKGLRQSPRIVWHRDDGWPAGTIGAEAVSCLVIPDKCIGLPTLAALKQGIPVIAVRENRNILENDLTRLPWAPGQLWIVENYWEAAGVVAALKSGLDPRSARRPLELATREVYGPGTAACKEGAALRPVLQE